MRRENYKVGLICEEFIQKGERERKLYINLKKSSVLERKKGTNTLAETKLYIPLGTCLKK